MAGYRQPLFSKPEVAVAGLDGLEHSCKPVRDGLRRLGTAEGIEQIEAAFSGEGFSPHRHDTYGIGITLSGVQTFRYRGAARASLPGNLIVLHPDELHDGAAGTESGLVYRIVYVEPEKIAAATGLTGRLPFVPDPVVDDPHWQLALATALHEFDASGSALSADMLVSVIAEGLQRHGDDGPLHPARGVSAAIEACRRHLRENCLRDVGSGELEAIAGIDRYELARQFRRAYGTSPHRYLIMRRLDHARQLLHHGAALADAAAELGFADQAHFTRHFRKAYGLTPGRWRQLHGAAGTVVKSSQHR